MTPLRILGLTLLALGVVLLVIGLNATETVGEELRQEFTGQYSDETIWYIGGGVVAIVAGLALSLFGSRFTKHA